MTILDDFKDCERLWLKALNQVTDMLCRRCAKHKMRQAFADPTLKPVKVFHNDGQIQTLMAGPERLPIEEIEAWFEDVEHGFFHGICVAFVGHILTGDEWTSIPHAANPLFDNRGHSQSQDTNHFLAMALLHDWCRSGRVDEPHDKKLRDVFPNLLESVYSHSNPPRTLHRLGQILIKSDRLELLRFQNSEEWIKPELMPELTPEQQRLVDVFYRNIRPALEYAWVNRREIWVAYGTEIADITEWHDEAHWPQMWTRSFTYGGELCWPAEAGRMPLFLRDCLHHWVNSKPVRTDVAALSWHLLTGVTPMRNVTREQPAITPGKGGEMTFRDHPHFYGSTPITQWMFLHLPRTEDTPEVLKKKLMIPPLEQGRMVASVAMLESLFAVANLVEARLAGMRAKF